MGDWKIFAGACTFPPLPGSPKSLRRGNRTSPEWASHSKGSNVGIEKSHAVWGHMRWHGRPASGKWPLVKHRLWVPRPHFSQVWQGSLPGGTHGDERAPCTCGQWDCPGDICAGGDVGKASEWHTITQLPRTNGNSRVWRDSLDQLVVGSAGNKPRFRACGHPVSRSSSKQHPSQGLRQFGKGALMYTDPRTRLTMTRRETRSNRRWVPKPRSPEDGKWRGSSPKSDVVRSRYGPGRRDAEKP